MNHFSYSEQQARRDEDRYLERQVHALKATRARAEQETAQDRQRLAGLGLVSDKDRTTASNRTANEADATKRRLERLAEARWGAGAQSLATTPSKPRSGPVPPAGNNGARAARSAFLASPGKWTPHGS